MRAEAVALDDMLRMMCASNRMTRFFSVLSIFYPAAIIVHSSHAKIARTRGAMRLLVCTTCFR